MELMRQYDPAVVREAFEAELSLEKERSEWLQEQVCLMQYWDSNAGYSCAVH